ncbi:hypothetical protein (nucleomorph) [Guillardia theta]|uniref:Uncharacterized protein n=1 Tax=Guillardia theta TaxID=55529 RepID=Q98SA7_GUITH|nr:hypothetical protein GTHECHR3032 [Guillardia theta]AAK39676.1 hypothetical protein [Guillardia theta]
MCDINYNYDDSTSLKKYIKRQKNIKKKVYMILKTLKSNLKIKIIYFLNCNPNQKFIIQNLFSKYYVTEFLYLEQDQFYNSNIIEKKKRSCIELVFKKKNSIILGNLLNVIFRKNEKNVTIDGILTIKMNEKIISFKINQIIIKDILKNDIKIGDRIIIDRIKNKISKFFYNYNENLYIKEKIKLNSLDEFYYDVNNFNLKKCKNHKTDEIDYKIVELKNKKKILIKIGVLFIHFNNLINLSIIRSRSVLTPNLIYSCTNVILKNFVNIRSNLLDILKDLKFVKINNSSLEISKVEMKKYIKKTKPDLCYEDFHLIHKLVIDYNYNLIINIIKMYFLARFEYNHNFSSVKDILKLFLDPSKTIRVHHEIIS